MNSERVYYNNPTPYHKYRLWIFSFLLFKIFWMSVPPPLLPLTLSLKMLRACSFTGFIKHFLNIFHLQIQNRQLCIRVYISFKQVIYLQNQFYHNIFHDTYALMFNIVFKIQTIGNTKLNLYGGMQPGGIQTLILILPRYPLMIFIKS